MAFLFSFSLRGNVASLTSLLAAGSFGVCSQVLACLGASVAAVLSGALHGGRPGPPAQEAGGRDSVRPELAESAARTRELRFGSLSPQLGRDGGRAAGHTGLGTGSTPRGAAQPPGALAPSGQTTCCVPATWSHRAACSLWKGVSGINEMAGGRDVAVHLRVLGQSCYCPSVWVVSGACCGESAGVSGHVHAVLC